MYMLWLIKHYCFDAIILHYKGMHIRSYVVEEKYNILLFSKLLITLQLKHYLDTVQIEHDFSLDISLKTKCDF